MSDTRSATNGTTTSKDETSETWGLPTPCQRYYGMLWMYYHERSDQSEQNDAKWDLLLGTTPDENIYADVCSLVWRTATTQRLEMSPQIEQVVDFFDAGLKSDLPDEEAVDPDVFVHDFSEDGITVNWKAAKQLYKRIKQHDTRAK